MKQIIKYKVSIVLPNWNGAALLVKNLPAVILASKGAEIIVSDDASSDNSISVLAQTFPNVIVVKNLKKQGFAGNVNRGVARSSGDIIILLNTDVRPEVDFLDALLSHFEDPTVFAVGCLEQSHEKEKIIERGRGLSRWERGYFIHSKGRVKEGATAWVSGGSGAFRRSMWDEIGGMDTLYNPFYWEDIDLSYTGRKAGYRTLFEPKSIVGHFHEEGMIKTRYSSRDIKRIAYRNQFFFIWKNLSDSRILFSHMLWTPIRLFQALVRGDTQMLFGFISALYKLPQVISSRRKVKQLWKRTDSELSLLV